MSEEVKVTVPVLITPQKVELSIKTDLISEKLSIAELQKTALELVKNEDHLKEIDAFLKKAKEIKDKVEALFQKGKKPHWDNGKAWDAGKKLVFEAVDTILGTWPKDYQKMLDDIAEKDRKAKLKKAQDEAILKGIEDNVVVFSNKIIAAVTLKELTAIQNAVNFEKSPSREKKYGEFHTFAMERFDTVLNPILKDQKIKVAELEKLNKELLEAETHNDPDRMDELMPQIDALSNEILQNHANLQEAALNQESFPVMVAEEVLPEFRVKRTNYTFEIVDVEKAFRHARSLLEITVNNTACREELEALKKKDAFKDTDEVVVHGIKFIANKVREAL